MANGTHSAKGYSIWLMPDKKMSRNASKVIHSLSSNIGTTAFEPHITLLGSISGSRKDVLRKFAGIAREVGKMELKFGTISHSDVYFRSVFIRIKNNASLKRAHGAAAEAFNVKGKAFMPHMSLVYSDLGSAERILLVREIKPIARWLRFNVASIALYSVDGEVKDWYRIKDFRV